MPPFGESSNARARSGRSGGGGRSAVTRSDRLDVRAGTGAESARERAAPRPVATREVKKEEVRAHVAPVARQQDKAPGLSTDGRAGAPGRREPARQVTPVSPAEAQAKIRATMLAHVSAAARGAHIDPRVIMLDGSGQRLKENGAPISGAAGWEMRFPARMGILRGWPRVTWSEATRELTVSVKTLWGETLVHAFRARSVEHYGAIAQTVVSLVVARAR